jgi:hypothetical protein
MLCHETVEVQLQAFSLALQNGISLISMQQGNIASPFTERSSGREAWHRLRPNRDD